jgi:hypothetical protein
MMLAVCLPFPLRHISYSSPSINSSAAASASEHTDKEEDNDTSSDLPHSRNPKLAIDGAQSLGYKHLFGPELIDEIANDMADNVFEI